MAGRSGTRWALVAFSTFLGLLLAVQLQASDDPGRNLQQQSVEDLTTLIGTLTLETDRMQSELTDLTLRIAGAQTAAESAASLLLEQEESLLQLQVLTGAAVGEGPGISLSIADADFELEPYDFFTLVNELRSAGSEAIVLDGRRLDLRANFSAAADGIALDGRLLTRPYHLHAVGDPEDLASSLRMPGGVIPSLQNRPGITISLVKRDSLLVPQYSKEPVFEYAGRATD